MKPMESNRMLILSLSTRIAKKEEKYSAVGTSKWGLFNWVYDNGSALLSDAYGDESSDMVDIHVSTLFQSLRCSTKYLRIQDDTLSGGALSVDIATKENMEIENGDNASLENIKTKQAQNEVACQQELKGDWNVSCLQTRI
ncbi:hypothetical protein U1Q18_013352 [Sarracenia purpurea var. burkii]